MTRPHLRRRRHLGAETAALGARWRWVQVFENKGDNDGLLEPAPARADLGTQRLPNEPAAEDVQQRA